MRSWLRGLRGRLLAVALLPLLGFSISMYIAFNGVSRISDYLEITNKDVIPNIEALDRLIIARNKFGYHLWAAIALFDQGDIKSERLKLAKEALSDWKQGFEDFHKLSHIPEVNDNLKFIDENKDIYVGLLTKVVALVEAGEPEKLNQAKNLLLHDVWKLGSAIGSKNMAIAEAYRALAARQAQESEEAEHNVYIYNVAVNIGTSLLIFILIVIISNKISGSISVIGQKLSGASQQVTASVEQLNSAGAVLSQSSTESAASLEETVASLEELSSMVQMNTENAKQAESLSLMSKATAEKGEKEIRQLINSMKEISDSSKKIEEIISVIDDIAFQTNLLALNASVEAARAGEQGKGFAVVAEAVRTLAQRSAVAAKDISELIQLSVSQIEKGAKVADESGEMLGQIVSSVKKVTEYNEKIAASSNEQHLGIQQISKAMNQLDQSSQGNAASAEELAASSEEISQLAVIAQRLTEDLTVLVEGQSEDASAIRNYPSMQRRSA